MSSNYSMDDSLFTFFVLVAGTFVLGLWVSTVFLF
jgi:hypothetical protein